MINKKIKVLIVDDSALVRNILAQGLKQDPGLEVVDTAADPYAARDKIIKHRPDVLTLDVEMPRMDGVAFLRRLMPQYPLPVVMVSALTQKGKQITLDALEAGAVDFVAKPATDISRGLNEMMLELCTKIKIASTANVAHWKSTREGLPQGVLPTKGLLKESTNKLIAIGASTGGTEAVKNIVVRLPADTPGVVVVLHMPAGFTRTYADRLNAECVMEVKEAQSSDRIMPGKILVAPGDFHMRVKRSGGFYEVECVTGEKVNGHRPAVDVLMHSVAENVGANAVGVILTGMGGDGANGLAAMRKAGSRTIAQDEASCVVFGMPKVAYERGGAERLVPLHEIAPQILKLSSGTAT